MYFMRLIIFKLISNNKMKIIVTFLYVLLCDLMFKIFFMPKFFGLNSQL